MDFLESGTNFDDLLQDPNFSPHFDQLELDSLLYGSGESPQSSSSSSFAYGDQTAGFRSRDGGSLGDSSSDSSPPLSCANFTENDQEMWEFGFQNPSPFSQKQFEGQFQEDEVVYEQDVGQHYIEEEQQVVEEPQRIRMAPNRVVAVHPKQHVPVRRVISRPIQKMYRMREGPVIHPQSHTYRIVQPIAPQPRIVARPAPTPRKQHQQHQPQPTTVYYDEVEEMPITSGPLIRHVEMSSVQDDKSRYVAIAPTSEIKPEVTRFSQDQHRKIRNRMYAQASRIRKKEQDEMLRQTLQELQDENEILRTENSVLKQRLLFYESEDQIQTSFNVAHKSQRHRKVIAAGSVLMMFGLFAIMSPFSFTTLSNTQPPNTQLMAITNQTLVIAHHGRVIGNGEEITSIAKAPTPERIRKFNNGSHYECESYKLNATETIRVNKDIDRWVQVHSFDNVPVKFSGGLLNKEAMRKFNEDRKAQKSTTFGPQKLVDQKRAEQAALRSRERTWRQLDLLKSGNDMVPTDVQRKRQNIDKIASVVRQKGDTLYIMTLQDYVLLPSLKKGANSIPKLSLLLPSVPMNGTLLDQYTLLRVDCEVTGTGQLTLSNKQLSYLMP